MRLFSPTRHPAVESAITPLNLWRGGFAFLLAVTVLQFFLLTSRKDSKSDVPSFHIPSNQPYSGSWSYEFERDGTNPGLSLAQCDQAFPDLYYEVDRAVSLWKDRGHDITQADTDISWRRDAAFRCLIHDNQLRILEMKRAWFDNPYRVRTTYVLLQLQRALTGAAAAGEKVPDIEFSVVVDDMSLINAKHPNVTTWAFTRLKGDKPQDRLWLIPDKDFYAVPKSDTSFLDMQGLAMSHDSPLIDKLPQVIWRGSVKANGVRKNLMNAAKDKDWADVADVGGEDVDESKYMTMDNLCRYFFTVHTEGRSWSGRLIHLLNCDSVPIVHKLGWTAIFYHLFKKDGEEQNYVPVKRDFSDLEEKVQYYLDRPEEAQRIVNNSIATFRSRYTTPAAEACYWRRLVHGYASVSFTPEPFEMVTVNVSGKVEQERHVRGDPFEDFIYIKHGTQV